MKLLKFLSIIIISLSFTQASTAKEVLRVWDNEDFVDTIAADSDIEVVGIRQAILDFEEKYNVDVQVSKVKHFRQLDILLNSDKSSWPDIILIPNDKVDDAIQNDIIYPLSRLSIRNPDYLDISKSAFSRHGQMYGYPKVIETLLLFYNKDILPKPLKTMEEYLELSKKFHDEDATKYGLLAKLDDLYRSYPVIKAFGGYAFGRNSLGEINYEDIGLNTKETVRALDFIRLFYRSDLLPLSSGENSDLKFTEIFEEGKSAAVITGPWSARSIIGKVKNLGVTTLPMVSKNKNMVPFLGVLGYSITQNTKNRVLAEAFLEFINQRKYAEQRFMLTGELPPLFPVIRSKELLDNELVQALAMQAQNAELMPSLPGVQHLWLTMSDVIGRVVSSELPIQNELNHSVTILKKYLKEHAEGKLTHDDRFN